MIRGLSKNEEEAAIWHDAHYEADAKAWAIIGGVIWLLIIGGFAISGFIWGW